MTQLRPYINLFDELQSNTELPNLVQSSSQDLGTNSQAIIGMQFCQSILIYSNSLVQLGRFEKALMNCNRHFI